MNKHLGEAYLKFTPHFLRRKLQLHGKDYLLKLKADILNYYKNIQDADQETHEIISYLKSHNTVKVYPYSFVNEYSTNNIKVYIDDKAGFKYVKHNGKRMYFKKKWDDKKIQSTYRALSIEQDKRSPHNYLTDLITVNKGDIVCDLGAAEGIFSLNVIDRAKHIYIFESDSEWIDALNLTFAPWDNITIHKVFVSDTDSNKTTTLDEVFKHEEIHYLKADIEGEEIKMLRGAKKLLQNKRISKIALCTYHNQNDFSILNKILLDYGYSTGASNGYMIFLHDKPLLPPYLRRGLIRATIDSSKNNLM